MSDQQTPQAAHPIALIQDHLNTAMTITGRFYDTHMRMLAVLCQRNGGTVRINHDEALALPPGFDVEMHQDEEGVTLTYAAPQPPERPRPTLVDAAGKPLNGGG